MFRKTTEKYHTLILRHVTRIFTSKHYLTLQYFPVLNTGAQLNCGIEAIQKTQRFFACNCTEKHSMLQIFLSKIYGCAIFLIRARGCQLTGSEIQRRFHLFLLFMYESVACVHTPVGDGTSVYKLPAVCINCRDIEWFLEKRT